jgi:hypothetical protein
VSSINLLLLPYDNALFIPSSALKLETSQMPSAMQWPCPPPKLVEKTAFSNRIAGSETLAVAGFVLGNQFDFEFKDGRVIIYIEAY